MASSQPKPENSGNFRFEFDPVNKILLMRYEGRLTEKAAAEFYWAIRRYSTETDARAGIWDLSPVTEFAVSPEFMRYMVGQEPVMPEATLRPRFLVAPATFGLGISRMIEIVQGPKNPLFKVVLTLDEALAALGVRSPHFEHLE